MRIVTLEEQQNDLRILTAIHETVRKHADAIMKEHKFSYYTHPRYGIGAIQYMRNKSKDWQKIVFSATPSYIRLRPDSKKSGEMELRHYIAGIQDLWFFNSLEEFEELCPKVVDTATCYLPRLFELEIKIPYRPHYSDEFQILYDNRKQLSADFKKEFNFPDEPYYTDLKRLERMLEDRSCMSYEEAKEFILKAAAYFGEAVIKRFGGEWVLEDENSFCCVGFGDYKDTGSGRYCNVLPVIMGAFEMPFNSRLDLIERFIQAGKDSGSVDEQFLNIYR